MANLSLVGAPPGDIATSNIAALIFSNPYLRDGNVCRYAPTPRLREHCIPPIPREKPLFVDPASGASISWQRTKDDSLKVAAGLHHLGLHPAPFSPSSISPESRDPIISPIVLVHLPNCVPIAPITYGVFASGLTATMASPALTPGELAWVLQNANPQAAFTTPEGYHTIQAALTQLRNQGHSCSLSQSSHIFIVDPQNNDYATCAPKDPQLPSGTRDWKSLLHNKPLPTPFHFPSSECQRRTAVILWSSGTSGRSKGVVISHRALVVKMHAYWHANPSFATEHRWLGLAPFYHVFGMGYILLLAPCLGATVFVVSKFSPHNMLQYIQDYRITFLHMSPPVGVLLAKSPLVDKYDLSSLKVGVSGGAPFPAELLEMVYKRLGILVKLGYGLTEACAVCNQSGETWADLQPQLRNTGDSMFGVQLKVMSLDDPNTVVKRGQEGEILIKSAMLMNCYLNNPSATNEALDPQGWFHTGDVGKIDGKGYLWITDRLKEVIKVKGFQVSPSELEALLQSHPSIADAAVTSIYSTTQATELPRAYVVPAFPSNLLCYKDANPATIPPDLAALAKGAKDLVEAKLVKYKWLQGGVVFVPSIPKSASGKILRRLLKNTLGVEVSLYDDKGWVLGNEKARL